MLLLHHTRILERVTKLTVYSPLSKRTFSGPVFLSESKRNAEVPRSPQVNNSLPKSRRDNRISFIQHQQGQNNPITDTT